jgi:Leucine-rich repeat (LRR) protein
MGSVVQLQQLFLACVTAEQLPLFVEPWQGLTSLHLRGMGSCGPEVLAAAAELTNLRHLGLNLSDTSITALPGALQDLIHLTSLDLSYNLLTEEVLEGVCSMTRLRCLKLVCVEGFTWSTLPPSISKLVHLQALVLQGPEMGSLSEAMTALTALWQFTWSAWDAPKPMQMDVVWRLKSLYVLTIEDHHMAALPDTISQLTNLRKLHIHADFLTALPSSMSNLLNLVELNVDSAQLQILPRAITALTNLQRITAPGVLLRAQSPAVRAFLAGRKAQGCELKLAPSQ